MKKLTSLFVIIMSFLILSCEKDNNQKEENKEPEIIIKTLIAGDTDIDTYIQLDPAILIVNDCITQYDDYYCLKTFDLNLNGDDDFGISFSGNPSNYWMEMNFYNLSNFQLACNEDDYLLKLNKGDTINYALNWKNGSKFLMTYSGAGEIIGDNWYSLNDDAFAFVGFRKLTETDTILGWFRLTKTNSQQGNAIHTAYKIADYALSKEVP